MILSVSNCKIYIHTPKTIYENSYSLEMYSHYCLFLFRNFCWSASIPEELEGQWDLPRGFSRPGVVVVLVIALFGIKTFNPVVPQWVFKGHTYNRSAP